MNLISHFKNVLNCSFVKIQNDDDDDDVVYNQL